jgi:hypothetical protein
MYKQIDWDDQFENFEEGNPAAFAVDCTQETHLFEEEL